MRGPGRRPGSAPCRLSATAAWRSALHDIEPATFEHCTLIREWLLDLGVDKATLCVVPAADHHPFFQRSPAMSAWLQERRGAGDAIAQQGFVGGRGALGRSPSSTSAPAGALLALAGLEPRGYQSPSLGHALGAWRELARTFDWWMAAGVLRPGSLPSGGTLRVDVHPAELQEHPSRTRALERTLRRAAERRRPVTYDELAGSGAGRAAMVPADVPRVLRAP